MFNFIPLQGTSSISVIYASFAIFSKATTVLLIITYSMQL